MSGPQPLWVSASSEVDRRAVYLGTASVGAVKWINPCPGIGLGTGKEDSASIVPWAAVGPSNPKAPSLSQAQPHVDSVSGTGPCAATLSSVCLCLPHISASSLSLHWHMLSGLDTTFWKSPQCPSWESGALQNWGPGLWVSEVGSVTEFRGAWTQQRTGVWKALGGCLIAS